MAQSEHVAMPVPDTFLTDISMHSSVGSFEAPPPGHSEKAMEAWLQQKREWQANQIVAFNGGLQVSTPIYFAMQRYTSSDVLSVITTTKCSTTSRLKPMKMPPLSHSSYTSPLRNKHDVVSEELERRNQALWREAELFLSSLTEKRLSRLDEELRAATKIQSMFRGWRWRTLVQRQQKNQKFVTSMKKGFRFLNKSIHMVLRSRSRQGRELAARNNAATVIQSMARRRFAWRMFAKMKAQWAEELVNNAAREVQRVYRGQNARQVTQKLRDRVQEEEKQEAASTIQALHRGNKARKEAAKRRKEKEHKAATNIQRIARGRFARRRVTNIKADQAKAETDKAATKVQSRARGYLARKKYTHRRRRLEDDKREQAAVKIQSAARGRMARRRTATMRQSIMEEEMKTATVQIQKTMRGHLHRKNVRRMRLDREKDVFYFATIGNYEKVAMQLKRLPKEKVAELKSSGPKRRTVAHIGALHGNLDVVQVAIERGVDINAEDGSNKTAVELAVQGGHDAVALWLLQQEGCELGGKAQGVLNHVAQHGLDATLKYLVWDKKLDVKASHPETLRTALHCACLHDAPSPVMASTVRFLLENHSEPSFLDATDSSKNTALHYAARSGDEETVTVLLEAGAKPNGVNADGDTPWNMAVTLGHTSVAKLIRQMSVSRSSKSFSSAAAAASSSDASSLSEGEKATLLQMAAYDFIAFKTAIGTGIQADFMEEATGDTPLIAAARTGNSEAVALCLAQGCNVNRINAKSETALHVGAAYPTVANALIRAGADVSKRDSAARTALHYMALHGTLPAKHIMKASGIDEALSANDLDGRSPVHMAAFGGHAAPLSIFLGLGADNGGVDLKGNSTAHLACDVNGWLQYIAPLKRVMLENEARQAMNARSTTPSSSARRSEDGEHKTARHSARSSTNSADRGAKALEDLGPEVERRLKQWLAIERERRMAAADECIDLLEEVIGQVHHLTNKDGNLPLHLAAAGGAALATARLIALGSAQMNKPDSEGRTAALLAAANGHAKVISALAEAGADLTSVSSNGETAMYAALVAGHTDCYKVLRDNGVPIAERVKEEATSLHAAASASDAALLSTVLQDWKGLPEDAPMSLVRGLSSKCAWGAGIPEGLERDEYSPLDIALFRGQAACVRLLLEEGATPPQDAVLLAAAAPNASALYFLLKQGQVDLKVTDSQANTALHLAAQHGNVAALRALLGAGASEDAENAKGERAVQVATQRNQKDAVEFLTLKTAETSEQRAQRLAADATAPSAP